MTVVRCSFAAALLAACGAGDAPPESRPTPPTSLGTTPGPTFPPLDSGTTGPTFPPLDTGATETGATETGATDTGAPLTPAGPDVVVVRTELPTGGLTLHRLDVHTLAVTELYTSPDGFDGSPADDAGVGEVVDAGGRSLVGVWSRVRRDGAAYGSPGEAVWVAEVSVVDVDAATHTAVYAHRRAESPAILSVFPLSPTQAHVFVGEGMGAYSPGTHHRVVADAAAAPLVFATSGLSGAIGFDGADVLASNGGSCVRLAPDGAETPLGHPCTYEAARGAGGRLVSWVVEQGPSGKDEGHLLVVTAGDPASVARTDADWGVYKIARGVAFEPSGAVVVTMDRGGGSPSRWDGADGSVPEAVADPAYALAVHPSTGEVWLAGAERGSQVQRIPDGGDPIANGCTVTQGITEAAVWTSAGLVIGLEGGGLLLCDTATGTLTDLGAAAGVAGALVRFED